MHLYPGSVCGQISNGYYLNLLEIQKASLYTYFELFMQISFNFKIIIKEEFVKKVL